MAIGAAIGSAVIGGVVASKAASKGAKAQTQAAATAAGEQRAARLAFEERTDPFREAGLVGAEQLTSFLQDPSQQLAEINPVVDFLRQQGFEQIQESAAAGMRLGAGGTLQDLTRFNTQLASTIAPQLQNQRFNQLFNVAGLGANVAAGQGTAGLQTAANLGNLQIGAGRAQAAGITGQAGAFTGTLQNIAGAAGAFPNLFGTQAPAAGGGFQFDPSSVPAGSITGATF
jgi:hypothetical protein